MLRVDDMTDEHLDVLREIFPDAYEWLERYVQSSRMAAVQDRQSPVVRIGQGIYATYWLTEGQQ